MLENYYNRHSAQDNYERVLFRAGKGLQSAELNEIQSQAFEQTRSVADAILKEGDLVQDGQVVIQDTTALVEAGRVYLRGAVRNVPQASVTIALNKLLDIGVWLTTKVITEMEDPSLRDPANHTRNYDEPGAARQQYACEWGLADAEIDGDFFPVHKIDNGVVLVKQPPPQLDSVTVALARYDKESNGSYVVEGLRALFLSQSESKQNFTISEGKAHVDGLEIRLKSAIRKSFDVDPDLQKITSESQQFEGNAQNKMVVQLAHSPIAEVLRVNGAKQVTVNLQRGIYDADPLPNSSVYDVISVKQGQTVFKVNTDFRLNNDTIDWAANGDEPASSSSYEVTYRYRTDITPTNVTETGFTLSGLVDGEVMFVDYKWKLPRTDAITIDSEGVIRRIKGISHAWAPSFPTIPTGQLSLAKLEQRWTTDNPVDVENHAIRAVPMSELEEMQQQIHSLFDLVAIERLRNDANLEEPVAKKGVFVDPFLDDDLRDKGVQQTAAIIDGELVLPINGSVDQIGEMITEARTLPYTLTPILVQDMRTGSMKVNPYQAFEPIPAQVTLQPAVDRWTVERAEWNGQTTHRFFRRRRVRSSVSTRFVQTGTRTEAAEFLRQREVKFTARGFGPHEQLASLVFDGISVTAE